LSKRELDLILESMDKSLDRIADEILRRRPGKRSAGVGPKENGSVVPSRIGGDTAQRPTHVTYVLPSWRKHLEGELPDNVAVATEFNPGEGAGVDCIEDAEVVTSAHVALPLANGKPALNRRRKG
jgi:hypothetical protein